MRKFIFLLGMAFLCHISSAQSPLAFPYQAVARDSFGTPIPDQAMRIRLTIRDSSAIGPIKYRETDSISTDNLGMFTVNIGSGTADSGTFSSINWASAAKYLQIELDPTGGNSYTNMGASQLLSVPYALHSLTTNGVSNMYTFPNSTGSNGQVLTSNGAGILNWTTVSKKNRFGITIDGLGDVITTGSKGFTQIPYNGTITGWTVVADGAGSCVIDVKRSTYSSFPTTTTIAGTALPTLTSAQKNNNTSLSGWGSTTITAGDMFEFVVNSATTVKRVTVIIETTME